MTTTSSFLPPIFPIPSYCSFPFTSLSPPPPPALRSLPRRSRPPSLPLLPLPSLSLSFHALLSLSREDATAAACLYVFSHKKTLVCASVPLTLRLESGGTFPCRQHGRAPGRAKASVSVSTVSSRQPFKARVERAGQAAGGMRWARGRDGGAEGVSGRRRHGGGGEMNDREERG